MATNTYEGLAASQTNVHHYDTDGLAKSKARRSKMKNKKCKKKRKHPAQKDL